jgi:beta-glucanase (GH16 family)
LDDTQYSIVGGKLLIRTDASGYGFGLTTIRSLTPVVSRPGAIATNDGRGVVYQFGYFECRMKFDNAHSPRRATGHSWPAFWSNGIQGPQGKMDTYAELDFMEAYPVPSSPYVSIVCTLHEWTRGWTPDGKPSGINKNVQNSNNAIGMPSGFAENDFNVYGCLWKPTEVQWFINNRPVAKVRIGPGTPYPSAYSDAMYLVLGTGKDWPVTIDFVHVWQ